MCTHISGCTFCAFIKTVDNNLELAIGVGVIKVSFSSRMNEIGLSFARMESI